MLIYYSSVSALSIDVSKSVTCCWLQSERKRSGWNIYYIWLITNKITFRKLDVNVKLKPKSQKKKDRLSVLQQKMKRCYVYNTLLFFIHGIADRCNLSLHVVAVTHINITTRLFSCAYISFQQVTVHFQQSSILPLCFKVQSVLL